MRNRYVRNQLLKISKTSTFFHFINETSEFDGRTSVDVLVLNIILFLLTGRRQEKTLVQQLAKLLAEDKDYQRCTNTLYHTPTLQYLMPLWSGYNKFSRIQTQFWILFKVSKFISHGLQVS